MNIVTFLKNKTNSLSTLLLLFLISTNGLALDPLIALNDYQVKIYDVNDGLPNNTIQTMIQSKKGYLWLGTPAGLIRFDGLKYKIFNAINTPVLKNDNIISLYEDLNGILWIGTTNGLYSYHQDKWKKYTTADGLSNNHINSIVSDWKGTIWVGTNYGLNSVNKDGIKHLTTEDGLYDNIITSLTFDLKGDLWIGTLQGGISRFNDKITRTFDYNDGLLNSSINTLMVDHTGTVWIGTLGGLYYFKEEAGNILRIQGTNYTPVTSLVEDGHFNLWSGTMSDGLKRFYKGIEEVFNSESGFPDDFIRCMINEKNGNIWIGTDTRGLIQLKETKIKSITINEGLPENVITTVMIDHSGNLWTGTRNNGLCKIGQSKIDKIYNKTSGLSGNRISALYEDTRNNIWIGSDGGLDKLKNGEIENFSGLINAQLYKITSVVEDGSGNIWFGTGNGLYNLKNKKNTLKVDKRLNDIYIRNLIIGRENDFYICTQKGVYQKAGSSFKRLAVGKEKEIDVTTIFEDKYGVLWIGTNGKGLYKWPLSHKESCSVINGLPDNSIFSITEDNFGNLWMSSYKGVFKINRKSLIDFFDGKISYLLPQLFDQSNGMAGNQCSNEGQPLFAKSKSGRLFYPTTMGVVSINPGEYTKQNPTPPVFIEDILNDNISMIKDDKIQIPYQNNIISVKFTAFDYNNPGKIKFRYKLEGHKPEWEYVNVFDERNATYKNLDPGKYRFLMQSAGNNSQWSKESADVEFEILSPFYSKAYFYVIVFLIMSSLAGIIVYRKNEQQVKKQTEKYKTLPVDPKKAHDVYQKLQMLMENDRLFLDPDITLKDLSKKLRVHYNVLSRVVNEKSGLSYNDFINKYRIDEAKKKLSEPSENNKTILEILYDCGFNSKSVFNTTFKKFTGITPSEYRKQ